MQVKTILNQCHKFKSFVYDQVRFVKSNGERYIEVEVVPRCNGKVICSCCERPAPLYDRLNKRHFEFILTRHSRNQSYGETINLIQSST